MYRIILMLFLLLAGLSACTSLRDPAAAPAESVDLNLPITGQQQELPNWAQLFAAPRLQDLINEALGNNSDWQGIAARVQAANVTAQKDGRWPSVDLTMDDQRSDTNGVSSDSASAALRLSWELDLWGRLSQQKAVADWTAVASEYDAQWAKFSLSAQVAKAWLNVLARQQLWELNQQRLSNLQQSLELIEDGFAQGTREALDLYSARAELADGEASIASALRAMQLSQSHLNRLLGRYPGQALKLVSTLPVAKEFSTQPLSSHLLERRPDVQAAQANLAAQQARAKLAQKNRLPVFSLTARAGYANNSLSDVADGKNPFWSALANMTLPLFKGGALAAESKSQHILYTAAVADFKSVAMTAFQEALNSVEAEASFYTQWQAAQTAATISQQAEQQAMERYLSGLENFNTWLQSQRTAFARRITVLELHSQLLQNRVDMHLALGGKFGLQEAEKFGSDTAANNIDLINKSQSHAP